MGGFDPYSNSKGCAELVTAAFRSSFFNPEQYGQHGVALATARAGNVIGGGDWASDRLIPDILSAFAQGKSVVIRSPRAVRPWQHVLEPLRGYLALAERLYRDGAAFSESFNFGPSNDDTQAVEWIVRRLADLWGDNVSWVVDSAQHPHEATLLKLDISKASSRLDWRPRFNLSQALQLTVDWARGFQRGEDLRALTLSQIRAYEAQGAAA